MSERTLRAIALLTEQMKAGEERKELPERLLEPPAHPNCYCYVEDDFLDDGQPVEVWVSVLMSNTCETCEELDGTIISAGPWFGDTI